MPGASSNICKGAKTTAIQSSSKRSTARPRGEIDEMRSGDEIKRSPGMQMLVAFQRALATRLRHSSGIPLRAGACNSIAAWPRIELMLSAEESSVQLDAKADLAFFLNGVLLTAIAGALLVVDEIVSEPLSGSAVALYSIPFVLSWILLRASVGAAQRWGDAVRACIDVHRMDLYTRMGLRSPVSQEDEKKLAGTLSAAILRGEQIPDEHWHGQAHIPDDPRETGQ